MIPFEVEEMSSYLCLGADAPDSFCEANVEIMDAQVEFITTVLDLPIPEQCIPTFWTEDFELCGGRSGCYRQDTIYSSWLGMPHEIVHAVVAEAGLRAPLFMREGLAEALSGKALFSRDIGAEAIIELEIVGADIGRPEYESSGHFVAWMMDRFGADRVVELYDRLDPESGKDEMISTIEELMGLPFSSFTEEYELAQRIVYAGKGPFSCGASTSELPWDGQRTVAEVVSSCDSGEDYRRRDIGEILGHNQELWRGHRLSLSEGEYLVQLSRTGQYGYAILEMCLSEDTDEDLLPTPPAPVLPAWGPLRDIGFFPWWEKPTALAVPGGLALDLPAGTYTLWIGWIENPEPNIQLSPRQSFSIELL